MKAIGWETKPRPTSQLTPPAERRTPFGYCHPHYDARRDEGRRPIQKPAQTGKTNRERQEVTQITSGRTEASHLLPWKLTLACVPSASAAAVASGWRAARARGGLAARARSRVGRDLRRSLFQPPGRLQGESCPNCFCARFSSSDFWISKKTRGSFLLSSKPRSCARPCLFYIVPSRGPTGASCSLTLCRTGTGHSLASSQVAVALRRSVGG